MDLIFHEKQEGALCAQHCLNSLLQGAYYNAVDLAHFAQELDEAERERMSEGDVNSTEYLKFVQEPSSNMDDSGFFSIQVICKALQVWSLDLVPFNSPGAAFARQQPAGLVACVPGHHLSTIWSQQAFICNLRQHWFTIRKIGQQWFNLDSNQSGPVPISDTYLSLLLAQLQNEGYAIFAVNGPLPSCEADQYLKHNLIPINYKTTSSNRNTTKEVKGGNQSTSDTEPAIVADPDEVRRKRMQYFDRMQSSQTSETRTSETSKDTKEDVLASTHKK